MKKSKQPLNNQITIYQSPDGGVNIEVLYAQENIWLTQKKMAELFDVERSVITKHLKNIFLESELDENSVSAKFAHTATDGKTGVEPVCGPKPASAKTHLSTLPARNDN